MKNISLLLFFTLMSSIVAQEANPPLKDSTFLRKKDYAKQASYENLEYAFAPRKKSMWTIGVQGGYAGIFGDVRSKIGYNVGLNIQKGLGHVMAIRFQADYGKILGQDWKQQVSGTTRYKNFKTTYSGYELHAVAYLNNINFYKRNPKTLIYVFGGVGVGTRYTELDLYDANGASYDYSAVSPATTWTDQFRVLKDLNAFQDGNFDTEIPTNASDLRIRKTKINPTIAFGAGLSFKLHKRIDLNIEQKFTWHNDDMYDGTELTRFGNFSSSDDLKYNTVIGLNFKVGKRMEPLYWVNPIKKSYDDEMALKKAVFKGEIIKDEDGDGVADILDQQLPTPPNTLVNTLGIALDSDGDGIVDSKDMQPYSPKGAPVDMNGVALDSDADGVYDVFDQEQNTPSGALVDAKGIQIPKAGSASNINMPNYFDPVFFDFNSSVVKSEFYPSIFKLATYLQNNPGAKADIVGHADNRASNDYNLKLAKNRADAIISILTTSFKINANRLNAVSKGENEQAVPGLPDKKGNVTTVEGAHYINRRATFELK